MKDNSSFMVNNKNYTFKEIEQQAKVWKVVYQLIDNQKESISIFLNNLQKYIDLEVILTGAGSSFFVAEMAAGVWQKNTKMSSKAIGTTEILTHPELYIPTNRPLLLISFARSGNSPESVAVINLVEEFNDNVFHLIITCNQEGKLANLNRKKALTFLLPEETNDRSLAMTSSVSSMYLVALLISKLDQWDSLQAQALYASEAADYIFQNYLQKFEVIAQLDFSRAVFLGSGLFLGLAHEAHLKMQELTNGKIICKFDSFLGFRHGPKAVVNDETLIVYFFSNEDYAFAYEKDLANSFDENTKPLYTIGISENKLEEIDLDENLTYFPIKKMDEEFLMLPHLVVAQLLSYYKSLAFGLNPDSPSENGAIHRVVQGVHIYPLKHSNTTK